MSMVKTRRSLITAFLLLSLLILLSGCGSGDSGGTTPYAGQLVRHEFVKDYSAKEVADIITAAFSGTGEDISALVASSTAAKAYVIEYYTKNVDGQLIVASGLVGVPSPSTGSYPVATYMHGTMFNNTEVPSCSYADPNHEALPIVALFAGHGYVAVMPDYIGQGKGSPVARPYLHAASTASSTTDMLKAVKELSAVLAIKLNTKLFICGLSQGGHATMATQYLIETSPGAQPFNLTASAPIAGPYSIPLAWDFWLPNNPYGVSPLATHLILAYRNIYGFTDTLSDIFQKPYDSSVERIDDGTLNGEQMYALLPKELQKLLMPNFITAVNMKTHPFYGEMVANNTYNFAPKTPTRLYHAAKDELLPYSSSEFAYNYMKSLGAKNISLVIWSDPKWNHVSSFIPSVLSAKMWFDTY